VTERSFPFDAGPGAAVLEVDWQKMAQEFLATGVISNRLNQLAVTADGSGMVVSAASGRAQVTGFFYENDAALALTIAAADATNPRIDTVVLRLDRAANSTALAVLTGTPAASPVPPALTQTDALYELPLADVRVNAAVGVINAGDVTDRRTFTSNANKVSKGGGDTIAASAATVIPLVVRGAASQSANLLEARDGAGALVASVNQGGALLLNNGVGAQAILAPTAATAKGLVVRGAASQSANLAEFQNSAGTVLTRVGAGGEVVVEGAGSVRVPVNTAETAYDTAIPGVGARRFVVGPVDSAGAGFRSVRVTN
jgi:hypothetical protein